MAQLDDADLRYESAFWKYAMAVAANISDPADHQRIVLDATDMMLVRRDNDLGLVKLFFESSEWWGGAKEECDGGAKPPPPEGTVPGQECSEACPKALNVLPPVEAHENLRVQDDLRGSGVHGKDPRLSRGFPLRELHEGRCDRFPRRLRRRLRERGKARGPS